MSQHSLQRTIARLVFYAVAIVLLGWTGSLTYSFVANALPNLPWYVPLLSLVVFDLGMIAWLFVFLNYSEGSLQRAVALLTCGLDLIGVGLMVLAEILLGGQTWAAAPESLGEYAIWGIGAWTVFNVIAVVLFHLGNPDARRQMAMQAQKDAILEAAMQNLDGRRLEDGARVANTIADTMYHQLVADLFAEDQRRRDDTPTSPPLNSPGRQNGHYHSARPTPAGAEDTHQDTAPAQAESRSTVSLEVPEDNRPRRPAGR